MKLSDCALNWKSELCSGDHELHEADFILRDARWPAVPDAHGAGDAEVRGRGPAASLPLQGGEAEAGVGAHWAAGFAGLLPSVLVLVLGSYFFKQKTN